MQSARSTLSIITIANIINFFIVIGRRRSGRPRNSPRSSRIKRWALLDPTWGCMSWYTQSLWAKMSHSPLLCLSICSPREVEGLLDTPLVWGAEPDGKILGAQRDLRMGKARGGRLSSTRLCVITSLHLQNGLGSSYSPGLGWESRP